MPMPDLSTDEIARWLRARESTVAADLASAVPPAEEHEAVLPSVLRLGELLDDCLSRAPDNLRDRLRHERVRGTTRAILMQLGQGRRLRLLHWLGDVRGLEDLPVQLLRDASSEAGTF